MTPDRLRLRDGVEPARAATVLRDAVNAARQIAGSNVDVVFGAYRNWVETTEAQLASLTDDPDAVTTLLTPRHWQIVETGPSRDRLWRLLTPELDRQRAVLERLAGDLETRIARADGACGGPVVLDTNIILHYQRPDGLAWPEMVGRPEVRLVVPLRVVEELDAKKYSGERLAGRARSVLSWLEGTIAGGGTVRDDTTIEVLTDPTRRVRPLDADREILDACHELRQFGADPVRLVTGDTSMRLRARAESIDVVAMPDRYLPQLSAGDPERSD